MCFPETAGHLRTGHATWAGGQGGAGGGEGEVPAEDALCGCYRVPLSSPPGEFPEGETPLALIYPAPALV